MAEDDLDFGGGGDDSPNAGGWSDILDQYSPLTEYGSQGDTPSLDAAMNSDFNAKDYLGQQGFDTSGMSGSSDTYGLNASGVDKDQFNQEVQGLKDAAGSAGKNTSLTAPKKEGETALDKLLKSAQALGGSTYNNRKRDNGPPNIPQLAQNHARPTGMNLSLNRYA